MEFYEKLAKNVIDLISKKYSYLSVKTEEFEEAKKDLIKDVPNASNCNDTLKILTKYLSLFKDGHLEVVDSQGFSHKTWNLNKTNFDNETADYYLKNKKVFGPITVGDLENILYVRISSFSNRFKKNFEELYLLNPSQNKYIIDLRPNTGGDETLAYPLINFLLGDSGKEIAYYLRRRTDECDASKLSDFEPIFIKSDFKHPRKSVTVLIGPKTFSSGELTAMRLKAIPESIVIGDISSGGSGCPACYLTDGKNMGKYVNPSDKPDDFGSKFAIKLPSWLCYKADKTLLQNKGITPDILIPSKDSIVNSKDLVLEKAITRMK